MNPAVRAKLHWLVPLIAGWIWFCTVANRSAEQVLGLDNVENYGLAVFTQLFWMWSEMGEWAQTIHFGYVDSWMWSGHRVGWLPFVGWLYGVDPNPVWLTRIQIAVVALGAFPVWGMARDEIHKRWGGYAGLLLYFGFPPLSAIALQDYQDMVLSIPLLIGTIWQCRKGNPIGFSLFALATCMCREELIPMVVLIGLTHPGHWKIKLKWLLRAGVIAGVYAALIAWIGRDFSGYDTPMLSHSGDMIVQWPPVWTRTIADWENFYSTLIRPVHFLAFLSPLTVLPGFGALFFHLTAPAHGGVDTSWTGHIHHVAPIVGFVIAATIESTGRLLRFSQRFEKFHTPILAIGGVAGVITTAILGSYWAAYLQLNVDWRLRTPENIAPEWALIEDLPKHASIATDAKMSLVIANRKHAYTYDESLADKRPGEGLAALDFILVRKLDRSWVRLIQESNGKPIAETEYYELYDVR